MKNFCALLLLATAPLLAAERHVVEQKTFDTIAREFSGEQAQEVDRAIVQFHRIQGSPMMAEVAESVVAPRLRAAGLETRIEQFLSDGRTMYQSYQSPMGWSIREGELWVDGETPLRLCRYSDVPMCVSTYSKGGDWNGELVDVGSGTSESDYANNDLHGKVALASGYARDVVRLAVLAHGAVGAVIYPAATDRSDHPDLIRYNGVWTAADEVEKSSGSFQISANQYAMLRARMASGPVRVHGHIDATLGAGQLTLVHAWIRGTDPDADEIILTAHLDHPKWSANDNASGSADMVELARTLQTLIAAKKLAAPRRTIHMIWVPEYFGTIAYLTKHPEVHGCGDIADPRGISTTKGSCVIANLNLDMVGEDVVKTQGHFYMTRSLLAVPSFLDALLPDLLEQTREASLYAPTGTKNFFASEVSPYAPGSDHDLFLAVGVPASMFGHDPDWTHHSSEDTVDKTDASELRRVGTLAASAAYWIAAADDAAWQSLAPAVVAERLRSEGAMLISLQRRGNARLAARAQKQLAADAIALAAARLSSRGLLTGLEPSTQAPAHFARHSTIGPIDAGIWRRLAPADAKWLHEQEGADPMMDVTLFEAVNLMDGHRSSNEIADLLSIEMGRDYDAAWVSRLTDVLGSLQLVERRSEH